MSSRYSSTSRHPIRFLFAVLLLLSSVAAHASVITSIPSPLDDNAVKHARWKQPEIYRLVEADRKQIYAFEETLRTKTESELKALLGDPVPLDDSYVLPVSRHTAVGFSGLGYQGDMKNYFLKIGDSGGVLVFPYGEKGFVSAVAVYLKVTDDFIPLKSAEEFEKRRNWDQARMTEVKAALKKLLGSTQAFAEGNIAPSLQKASSEEISEALAAVESGTSDDLSMIRRGLISDQTAYRASCAQCFAKFGSIDDVPFLIDALSDESMHDGADYPLAGMATTRYWANVALIAICKTSYDYRWDASKKDREYSVSLWKQHWERVRPKEQK